MKRALAFIETGELRLARSLLEQISDYERKRLRVVGQNEEESLVATLAGGYLGLIRHLAGHLAEADRIYRDLIARLSRFERYRSVSFFCHHRSSLKSRQRNLAKARSLINRSTRATQAGKHQDLLHFARVSQGALAFKTWRSRAVIGAAM
ncbi:MAG: hypothetical protein HC869_03365 [Rhodospirillales bacterium]|nr:hypothetical protein [Rhodospirillales bacterium]